MIFDGSLCVLKISVSGQDDHLCHRMIFVNKASYFQSVCSGHFDICDYDIHRMIFQKIYGLHSVRSASHNLTVDGCPVHIIGDTFSHSDFVVNYKKLKYHGKTPFLECGKKLWCTCLEGL